MRLFKDGLGNYYTCDGQFFIERCLSGWDVHKKNSDGFFEYDFSVDTLKEFRLMIFS